MQRSAATRTTHPRFHCVRKPIGQRNRRIAADSGSLPHPPRGHRVPCPPQNCHPVIGIAATVCTTPGTRPHDELRISGEPGGIRAISRRRPPFRHRGPSPLPFPLPDDDVSDGEEFTPGGDQNHIQTGPSPGEPHHRSGPVGRGGRRRSHHRRNRRLGGRWKPGRTPSSASTSTTTIAPQVRHRGTRRPRTDWR